MRSFEEYVEIAEHLANQEEFQGALVFATLANAVAIMEASNEQVESLNHLSKMQSKMLGGPFQSD